jgi:phospholipase/lecithinase/hemolysin
MNDLNTLLSTLHTQTRAKTIVMGNLPDLTLLPEFANLSAIQKTQMNGLIQNWNSQIEHIAQKNAITIVDLYAQSSQLVYAPCYVSSDGFHPSDIGYRVLAQLFLNAINGSHAVTLPACPS